MEEHTVYKVTIKNYKSQYDTLLSSMPECFQNYLHSMEDSSSPRTVLGYANDLKTYAMYLSSIMSGKDPRAITADEAGAINLDEADAFAEYLKSYKTERGTLRTNSESAIRRKLFVVKGMYAYYQLHANWDNPFDSVIFPDFKAPKKKNKLTKSDVNVLMDSVIYGTTLSDYAKEFYHGMEKARDTAIMELLLSTGLRISEIVRLNLNDLYLEDGYILITRRNGTRARIIITDDMKGCLLGYLEQKEGGNCDALFLNRFGNRMSERSIQKLVKKYAAVLDRKDVKPNLLRDTFNSWYIIPEKRQNNSEQ